MTSSKLPFALKFAYGTGQISNGTMKTALGYFLLFYYNQVLGLSASLAGMAVGLSFIIDAFTDPLMGSLSDHWRSRFGRRHPFMYASILPVAVCFYFLFNPLVSTETGLFVWLMIFANATRTAVSIFNIPHMALGAEITDDYDDRSSLVSFRVFFENLGFFIVLGTGFGIFFVSTPEFENGQLDAAAYPPFALLMSAVMSVAIFWAAWGTRSVIPHLPGVPEAPKIGIGRTIVRVFTDMVSSLRNLSFRWLFGGMLSIYVVAGTNYALDLYMYSYFWELDNDQVFLAAVAYPAGAMFGTFFAKWMFAKWGKRTGLIIGALGWAFWQTAPVALRLMGLFPENSDVMLVPLLVGMKLIQGIFVAQADVGFGSLVADIVDEHELETNQRQEGIFYASMYFASKATSGVGSFVAGIALDIIQWPAGAHIKTAADIQSETIFELGVFYGPILAAFGFIAVWCFTHYRLTRERHAEILRELALRRS